MSDRAFLDTNIWIYAATGRETYPEKFRRAREIVATDDIGVSTQVVGEFVNVVQKPKAMRARLDRGRNGRMGGADVRLPADRSRPTDHRERAVHPATLQDRLLGQSDHRLRPKGSGADVLLSEDLRRQAEIRRPTLQESLC